MNIPDNLWPGQAQQVVIALQIRRPVLEPFAPIISLIQLVALDHGAHGAIQKQDALVK